MGAKPSIAIVGPGRLGSALAVALKRAGYAITEIVSHEGAHARRTATKVAKTAGARARTLGIARLEAEVTWFCVPDREIANAAAKLARSTSWTKKIAFHSSGALPSDELEYLRQHGAAVASVHPLMTFASGSKPRLDGVPFALEGDAIAVRTARRIARDLNAQPFLIRKQDKPAYHAWGAFASPLLVALLITAEQVARAAGVSANDARKRMLPILNQTLDNYATLGAAGALSGPLVRGDAQIVIKHLEVLKEIPEARDVYLALARATLRYLPVGNRKQLQTILTASRSTP
jgi:predicted short-subunit dehydrogenase-like oxidoreductase (DUF2520 family)